MRRSKFRIDEDGRECSKCGEYKIWDKYNHHVGRVHGHVSSCKECVSKRHKETYKPKSIKYKITDEGRECTQCGRFKLWKSFTKNKQFSSGYTAKCRECTHKRDTIPKNIIFTEEGRSCSKCGVFKCWGDFSIFNNGTMGRESSCKQCKIKYTSGRKKEKIIVEKKRYYTDVEKSRANSRYYYKKGCLILLQENNTINGVESINNNLILMLVTDFVVEYWKL